MTLIERDALFGNPLRAATALSPDGAHLAFLAPVNGIRNVFVRPVDGADADIRQITQETHRDITTFRFAPDGEHLMWLQDRDGNENWQLFDVSLSTGGERCLTPHDGVQAILVGIEPTITDRILIGLNLSNPQVHDVYELQLASGDLRLVMPNPGILALRADHQLRVRAGIMYQPDGGALLVTRGPAENGDQWRPALQIGPEDAMSTAPISFDERDDRLLIRTSVDANACCLAWLHPATGQMDIVVRDEHYDVAAVITDHRTHEPLAAGIYRDRLAWTALDERLSADLDYLSILDKGDLVAVSRATADDRWVVTFTHDNGPATTYLYVRDPATGGGEATLLYTDRPELESVPLAEMNAFEFTTRDGLTVHGYLTFPSATLDGDGPLPTVLMPHGGPWLRDTWGFDAVAQWLANRGYLVVHINYRGSTGYGKDFLNAGDRQWGARMHEDILDARKHVVQRGYADPGRVAILGGSFGGYQALVGAAFTPAVFAAAVSICGPTNLETLQRNMPDYWAPMAPQLRFRIGDPDTEPDFLASRSPLTRARDIRCPLLLAQGANDVRVPMSEFDQLVDALAANGVPHQTVVFPDEGHGLVKQDNRLLFFAIVEAFLAQHLDGECDESARVIAARMASGDIPGARVTARPGKAHSIGAWWVDTSRPREAARTPADRLPERPKRRVARRPAAGHPRRAALLSQHGRPQRAKGPGRIPEHSDWTPAQVRPARVFEGADWGRHDGTQQSAAAGARSCPLTTPTRSDNPHQPRLHRNESDNTDGASEVARMSIGQFMGTSTADR